MPFYFGAPKLKSINYKMVTACCDGDGGAAAKVLVIAISMTKIDLATG